MEKRKAERKKLGFKSAFRLALLGFLVGLSIAGAFIKIPSPVGTVALDSFPGYLASLGMGFLDGCIVIALGHLATAATAGFPLGLPGHLFIAAGMMLCAVVLRAGYRVHRILGIAAATAMNGVVLLYLFSELFGYGWGFFTAMVVPLTVASLLNVLVAAGLYEGLRRTGSLIRGSK